MAERPIFIPLTGAAELVKELSLRIVWHPGFASTQKKKNILALHEASAAEGYSPLLEVSTKSEQKLGRHLSAFHLKVATEKYGKIPIECAFQGSKIFERGGPYTDLYSAEASTAKRDERLQNSGRLIAFRFESLDFPLEPKTAFYDWLYVKAIFPHREWLARLHRYAGFTDIEFNPERSINCQARSCALFVSLLKRRILEDAVKTRESFVRILLEHSYQPHQYSLARVNGSLQ